MSGVYLTQAGLASFGKFLILAAVKYVITERILKRLLSHYTIRKVGTTTCKECLRNQNIELIMNNVERNGQEHFSDSH